MDPTTNDLNIVVIGGHTSGKSATANTLVGENNFNTEFQINVNQECKTFSTIKASDHVRINVVDTPELKTFLGKRNLIQTCLEQAFLGIHAFVFVIPADDRFSEKDAKLFDNFFRVFGKDVMNNIYLVFTKKDKLPQDVVPDVVDFLSQGPESLRYNVVRFGRRYSFIDNTQSCERENLLDNLVEMKFVNGSLVYTKRQLDNMFKEREKWYQEKIEKLERQAQIALLKKDKKDKKEVKAKEDVNKKTRLSPRFKPKDPDNENIKTKEASSAIQAFYTNPIPDHCTFCWLKRKIVVVCETCVDNENVFLCYECYKFHKSIDDFEYHNSLPVAQDLKTNSQPLTVGQSTISMTCEKSGHVTVPGPPIFLCHDCNAFICMECKFKHETIPLFKKHCIDSIVEDYMPKERVLDIDSEQTQIGYCIGLNKQHSKQRRVKFHCRTCNKGLCKSCNNEHQEEYQGLGHNVECVQTHVTGQQDRKPCCEMKEHNKELAVFICHTCDSLYLCKECGLNHTEIKECRLHNVKELTTKTKEEACPTETKNWEVGTKISDKVCGICNSKEGLKFLCFNCDFFICAICEALYKGMTNTSRNHVLIDVDKWLSTLARSRLIDQSKTSNKFFVVTLNVGTSLTECMVSFHRNVISERKNIPRSATVFRFVGGVLLQKNSTFFGKDAARKWDLLRETKERKDILYMDNCEANIIYCSKKHSKSIEQGKDPYANVVIGVLSYTKRLLTELCEACSLVIPSNMWYWVLNVPYVWYTRCLHLSQHQRFKDVRIKKEMISVVHEQEALFNLHWPLSILKTNADLEQEKLLSILVRDQMVYVTFARSFKAIDQILIEKTFSIQITNLFSQTFREVYGEKITTEIGAFEFAYMDEEFWKRLADLSEVDKNYFTIHIPSVTMNVINNTQMYSLQQKDIRINVDQSELEIDLKYIQDNVYKPIIKLVGVIVKSYPHHNLALCGNIFDNLQFKNQIEESIHDIQTDKAISFLGSWGSLLQGSFEAACHPSRVQHVQNMETYTIKRGNVEKTIEELKKIDKQIAKNKLAYRSDDKDK